MTSDRATGGGFLLPSLETGLCSRATADGSPLPSLGDPAAPGRVTLLAMAGRRRHSGLSSARFYQLLAMAGLSVLLAMAEHHFNELLAMAGLTSCMHACLSRMCDGEIAPKWHRPIGLCRARTRAFRACGSAWVIPPSPPTNRRAIPPGRG